MLRRGSITAKVIGGGWDGRSAGPREGAKARNTRLKENTVGCGTSCQWLKNQLNDLANENTIMCLQWIWHFTGYPVQIGKQIRKYGCNQKCLFTLPSVNQIQHNCSAAGNLSHRSYAQCTAEFRNTNQT